ncbi:MAG: hypothetical protein LBE22_10945 [Azoarcus sp.]|nr:hypothetical protein [Azoarcus sp.]
MQPLVVNPQGNVVTTWGTSAAGVEKKKPTLTDRQKEIVSSLRVKDEGKNVEVFDSLEKGSMIFAEIEILCDLNAEFMMEGILPTFEPNEYGLFTGRRFLEGYQILLVRLAPARG